MKEQPKMGTNRTGTQMSPIDSSRMTEDVGSVIAPPSGDLSAIVNVRTSYIAEAEPIGSVPLPGNMKGAIKSGASMLAGNTPQLLLDKLGERLAFERSGTRLYDALITKVASHQQEGVGTLTTEKLGHIREEEAQHAAMVKDAITQLGGDPTCMTPCADVAAVESQGLMQVITDARTTVAQSLHAILVAELSDNAGWETLIALAEAQGHDDIAEDFRTALNNERDHLKQVQGWFNELVLGDALPATEAGGSSLH